ncbi:hypothetical protein HDK64DRAFT_261673 [Phyllosticta capitalensis]
MRRLRHGGPSLWYKDYTEARIGVFPVTLQRCLSTVCASISKSSTRTKIWHQTGLTVPSPGCFSRMVHVLVGRPVQEIHRPHAVKSEPSKKHDTRHASTVLTNRIALSFGSLSSLILSNILCLILPAKRLTAIRATNEVSTKCNAANGPGNTVKGYPEFDSAEITSLRRDCYKRIYRTKKILQRKYVQIDKGVCSVSTVSGATAAVPSCRLGAPQMWQSVSAHFIASGMSKSERQIFNSDEVEIQVLLAVSVRKVERGLPSIYTYI